MVASGAARRFEPVGSDVSANMRGESLKHYTPVSHRDIQGTTRAHEYRLTGRKGERLNAEVLIPRTRGLDEYRVWLALVGPGLPEAPHELPDTSVPPGQAALVLPPGSREPFFEPFTLTRYWRMQQLEHSLPEDGEYRLLAGHPQRGLRVA